MAAEPEICVLSNGRITANIASWGATITSLLVPDAQGFVKDFFEQKSFLQIPLVLVILESELLPLRIGAL